LCFCAAIQEVLWLSPSTILRLHEGSLVEAISTPALYVFSIEGFVRLAVGWRVWRGDERDAFVAYYVSNSYCVKNVPSTWYRSWKPARGTARGHSEVCRPAIASLLGPLDRSAKQSFSAVFSYALSIECFSGCRLPSAVCRWSVVGAGRVGGRGGKEQFWGGWVLFACRPVASLKTTGGTARGEKLACGVFLLIQSLR
jgi:hypothetical protein